MQSVRDLLPAGFSKQMERALGREEALRRVWPAVVGPPLARNVQLKSFRGSTLTLSVPDRVWKGSLESLRKMILDAVNRFWGESAGRPVAQHVEFVVDLRMVFPPPSSAVAKPRRATAHASPPLDLPTEAIRDEALRRTLLESAQKYFAGQQERRK
jgi:hypothetical protein